MIADIEDDVTDCILGAKGSGKTVLLASMVNELDKRCILLDILGVLNPKNDFKSAEIPSSYYVLSVDLYLKHEHAFPDNAKVVIDMSNYYDNELIEAVDKLCKHLMSSKHSIAFLSDEVADIMPQQAKGSTWFHKLVKNGRNYGIKPIVFATQRPQSVSKSVFDLCDKFFISMQRAPRTIDYIVDILDTTGDPEIRQKVVALKKREFLIYDGEDIIQESVPEYPHAYAQ